MPRSPELARRPAPPSKPARPGTAARILDAAEAHFAQHGYDATSLADIADDVRIRAPSLYRHFASKRDLYVAVLERLLAPYFELLGRLLGVPADVTQADHNLVAVVRHYLETPRLAQLVQHAALSGDEELELLVEKWYRPLFRRAAELTPSAPAQALALVVAFHSMMSGYVTMAPLHARLTGRDPHGREAIAAQIELMRHLARELWRAGAATPPRKTRHP
jgi:TetR/AcrR family transcriptional regulator